MKIIHWNPKTLQDNDYFINWPKSIGFDLAVDVYEENSNVIAQMNIPGIDPDKIDVSIDNSLLHITGTREEEKEVKAKNYYSQEIKRGEFKRTIELPSLVIEDRAKAEYKDGVLKIIMPKKTSTQERVKVPVSKK